MCVDVVYDGIITCVVYVFAGVGDVIVACVSADVGVV